MNSIRKKLFIYIGLLIALLVGITLLANTFLYKPYYISKQKDTLILNYTSISEIETDDYDDSIYDFTKIENEYRIDILIKDNEGEIIYASSGFYANLAMAKTRTESSPILNRQNNDGLKENTPNRSIAKKEPIDENSEFLWIRDNIIGTKQLVLRGKLDGGYSIELKIPLAAIDANIQLANDFSLIIGAIVLVIAMIFAFIISNNFTKPIRQMNITTKSLKNLNFDSKCNVTSNDEIGQLAYSINEMSDELSCTMNQLNAKNKQLVCEIEEKTKLDEKRKELLNNVSHELKTPLGLMQGYAEGLRLNVSKNKEKSDFYCDVIMDEAIKMNQLVSKLLNINQVEFGDKTLKKSEFEVNKFTTSVLNKYQKIFSDKTIECNYKGISDTLVSADEFMIESVLTNYINNAINYVDDNKKISISIKEVDEKVRIEVFNTASPFSEHDIEKIWSSFYKVDKARTREKGGHGLGLAIVASVLKAHKNKYGVLNKKDGVCFWFDIDKA